MRHVHLTVGLVLSIATFPAHAQRQTRPEHDLRTYGVVETTPAMAKVRVKSVTYKTAEGRSLQMDVFSPPGEAKPPRPVVVFVNGVGDWPGGPKVRTWGQY